MKNKKFICVFVSLIFILSGLTPCAVASEPSVEYGSEYAEGEVIFEYEPPVYTSSFFRKSAPLSLDEQLSKAGITEYEDFYEEADDEQYAETNSFLCQSVATGDEPTVYYAKTDGDVIETCEKLRKIDGVTYAEPNYLFHTDTLPLEVTNNTSIYVNYQKWYLDEVMNIKQTWDTYDVSGDGVTVAVIDNGFKTDAIEFPRNLWLNSNGTPGWNVYEDSDDISPITYDFAIDPSADMSFHGTHVASIIGMLANGLYSVGAAYGAELMLIKVAYGNNQMTVRTVANGIHYAVEHGADVISASVGATGSVSTYDNTLKNAVQYAYDNGVAVIASAGNSSNPAQGELFNFPAAYENIAIGVMMIDKTDTSRLAYYSNYDTTGKYYEVAAPGMGIVGCVLDGISTKSGTSQATPLVSACVALYLEQYPDATVDQIYDAVKNSPTQKVKGHPDIISDQTPQFKSFNALNMLDYSKVVPKIIADEDTQAVIDQKLGCIYGLDEGLSDLSDYISIKSDTGSSETVPTENGLGTGTKFNVYDIHGNLYRTYTVIVFGDIDGDAYSDGQDAFIMKMMLENALTTDEFQQYAADSDFNGVFDENDIDMNLDNALQRNYIPQSR